MAGNLRFTVWSSRSIFFSLLWHRLNETDLDSAGKYLKVFACRSLLFAGSWQEFIWCRVMFGTKAVRTSFILLSPAAAFRLTSLCEAFQRDFDHMIISLINNVSARNMKAIRISHSLLIKSVLKLWYKQPNAFCRAGKLPCITLVS